MSREPGPPDGGGRRLLTYTVGSCLVGAGLALFAATRVWSVQVIARPGLSDLRTARTGGAEVPWLTALALVALAGAGALLATRGVLRRVLGVLLLLAGAGTAAGAVAGRAALDAGAAGTGAVVWPVACVAGGAAVMLGGWWTVRHGHRWPALGARYERPATAVPATRPAASVDDQAGVDADQAGVDTRVAWDALDRGEDPTA
jgi:uncharacterized membrane protein (TIGR02234 family)